MAHKQVTPRAASAVAYLRCSTDRQDLSTDAQREAIETWATRAGIEVAAWHEDRGVSGGAELDKRPGLLAAIEGVKTRGVEILVVAKRDRLARDVLTAAMVERLCERQGARIQSADGTGNGEGPEAELLRGVMDVFAQYERAIIRARTKAALAVKKAKGERLGGIPYGYRVGPDGVHLEEEPKEQAMLGRARELRAEGKSYTAIGFTLWQEGYRPRRGKKWHIQVLSRVLSEVGQSATSSSPRQASHGAP